MNGNSSAVHPRFTRVGYKGSMFVRILSLFLTAALCGAAGAAERPLALDRAQSRIEIVVKATFDSFTGRLEAFDPSVTLDDAGRIAGARVAFHFRDVLTGKPKRDKAMHEWQHTEEFPDGEFVLRSLLTGQDGQIRANGRLSFHGVASEITFPVSVTRQETLYAIDGDAAVDVRDFGLPAIRMMGLLKVDPVVHVKFHLQGRDGDAR